MYPSRPAPPTPDVAPFLPADVAATFRPCLSTPATSSLSLSLSLSSAPRSPSPSPTRFRTPSAVSRALSDSRRPPPRPIAPPARPTHPRTLPIAHAAAPPVRRLPELAILDPAPRRALLRDLETILGRPLHFPVLHGRRTPARDGRAESDICPARARKVEKDEIRVVVICEAGEGAKRAAGKRERWTAAWI
ncbi:hypothetical protein Q5752_002881 [Cryptotrichosporon argae]